MHEEPDWGRAGCRQHGVPVIVFFYEDHYPPSSNEYAQAREFARSICMSCPIRRDCAEYALDTNQAGGMWGGMTSGQRRLERRRRYKVAQLVLERTTKLQVLLASVHHEPHGESRRSKR